MRDTQPAGRTYTIGELATMSGTTERALRHYEDLGLLSPARGENGYRRYAEKAGTPVPRVRDGAL